MAEPMKPSLKRWIIAALIVTALLGLLAAYRWSNLVQEASERGALTGPVELTAKEMALAFDEDPIAADLRFDNRRVTVTGSYRGMSLGPSGDPAISLGEDPIFDVTAAFDKADVERLAALRQGEPLRITCTQVSAVATGPTLSECELPPVR